MTETILTEEDFQRIEEKRLAWLMQGKCPIYAHEQSASKITKNDSNVRNEGMHESMKQLFTFVVQVELTRNSV